MDRLIGHEEAVELLGAFAIDAVEPEDASGIRRHLAECPRCAEEVARYQEAASLLASTGGDAPPHLWDRIADEVARSGSSGGDRSAAVEHLRPRDESPDELPDESPNEAVLADRRRHKRPRWFVPVGAAAAAAVAVIALLGVQVARLNNRVGQLNAASERQGLVQAAQAALVDPQAKRVTLTSGTAGRALAQIVVLPSGTAFVINNALPGLPSSETYQLWGRVGGRTVSLGLLGSHPRDVAFTVNQSTPVAVFAVTAERAGGSVSPTRTPVAVSPGVPT